jgi:hypothetical protein
VPGVLAIFRGTERETMELLAATEHSCVPPDQCQKDTHGRVVKVCAAHRALLDQRFLDGVLYVRRNLKRFTDEENMRPREPF